MLRLSFLNYSLRRNALDTPTIDLDVELDLVMNLKKTVWREHQKNYRLVSSQYVHLPSSSVSEKS